jgi:hypothetical protein
MDDTTGESKHMDRIEEIELAIQGLSASELADLRRWFFEYDATVWDRQIAEDSVAGRLDQLADKALADFHSGRCKEI